MDDRKNCEFIDQAEISLNSTPEYKFGSVTDVIGGHGPWQLRHWFVFFLASIFNVMHLFSASLLFHQQCLFTDLSGKNINHSEELASLINVNSYPSPENCNSTLCKGSKNELIGELSKDLSSLVEQCSTNWITVYAKCVYVVGCTISLVTFQPLKLRYGRKPVSLISCVLWMGSCMATAFLYDSIAYLILRFLASFGIMNIFLISLTSLMNCLSQEYHFLYLICAQLSWGIARFLLPLLIWIGRGWFGFHTILSVGSILLLAFLCFIPESAAYFVKRGQWPNACKTLKVAAISNGFSPTRLEAFVQHWMLMEEKDYMGKKLLLKSYFMTLKVIILFFSSFMTSFLYLTLSYQVDWIGKRVGSNLALMGTSEVSSTVILLFVTCLVSLKYLWAVSSSMASISMLVAFSKLHAGATISTYLFLAMIFFASSAWTLLLLRSVSPSAKASKWNTIAICAAICIGAFASSALEYKEKVQDLNYIPILVWAIPHFLIGASTILIPDIQNELKIVI